MPASRIQRDVWREFSTGDIENIVACLILRCDAGVIEEDELSVLWLCGCELFRRRRAA